MVNRFLPSCIDARCELILVDDSDKFCLILYQLLESFEKKFPTLKFPSLPERGDFDLREVMDSTYFFN